MTVVSLERNDRESSLRPTWEVKVAARLRDSGGVNEVFDVVENGRTSRVENAARSRFQANSAAGRPTVAAVGDVAERRSTRGVLRKEPSDGAVANSWRLSGVRGGARGLPRRAARRPLSDLARAVRPQTNSAAVIRRANSIDTRSRTARPMRLCALPSGNRVLSRRTRRREQWVRSCRRRPSTPLARPDIFPAELPSDIRCLCVVARSVDRSSAALLNGKLSAV
jgi:hypothetical protein